MRAGGDIGSSLGPIMIMLGDRLGMYKALSEQGPMTSNELAEKTNTSERYIREGLASQNAADYLSYEPETKNFHYHPREHWYWLMSKAQFTWSIPNFEVFV